MEILRSLQIERVNLGIASQKTASEKGGKSNALSAAREQGTVARIKDHAGKKFTFHRRSLLRLDELRGAGIHVKDIDVLQRISQGGVHVCVDWLAQLE